MSGRRHLDVFVAVEEGDNAPHLAELTDNFVVGNTAVVAHSVAAGKPCAMDAQAGVDGGAAAARFELVDFWREVPMTWERALLADIAQIRREWTPSRSFPADRAALLVVRVQREDDDAPAGPVTTTHTIHGVVNPFTSSARARTLDGARGVPLSRISTRAMARLARDRVDAYVLVLSAGLTGDIPVDAAAIYKDLESRVYPVFPA